jgi:hypothetical protein
MTGIQYMLLKFYVVNVKYAYVKKECLLKNEN